MYNHDSVTVVVTLCKFSTEITGQSTFDLRVFSFTHQDQVWTFELLVFCLIQSGSVSDFRIIGPCTYGFPSSST